MTSPSAEIPEPEIEPCPWCGYAWPALVASTSDSSTVRVDCTCGASGIAVKHGAQRGVNARALAVREWNRVAALRRRAEEAEAFIRSMAEMDCEGEAPDFSVSCGTCCPCSSKMFLDNVRAALTAKLEEPRA